MNGIQGNMRNGMGNLEKWDSYAHIPGRECPQYRHFRPIK